MAAARPAHSQRGEHRAYPPSADSTDVMAVGAELAATRALLRAESAVQVGAIVSTLVHDLGGALVVARYADPATTVPVDVSLGLSEPVLPFADPVSVAAMRLRAILPQFLEAARLVISRLQAQQRRDEEAAHDQLTGVLTRPARGDGVIDPAMSAARYFRAVEAFDVAAASDLVLGLLDEDIPVTEIIKDVLAPAQDRTGRLWETGEWSVVDEHVATSVTDGALSALTHAATPRPHASGHHVAVACAEGEWHSMPARMAAAIAGATGRVRVTMLGPSMPADQLHRRLSAGDIDVLALSCTMPTHLIGAARCAAAAHDLGIPVIAGGRAFGDTPLRAYAIGADSWANDAEQMAGPPPALMGRRGDISTEVLMLDAADEATVAVVRDQMMAAFPALFGLAAYQRARAAEDLVSILRHTAGALLTDDPSIVEELLIWLRARWAATVPASAVTTAADLLASAIEPQTATGAALLRGAAARVRD